MVLRKEPRETNQSVSPLRLSVTGEEEKVNPFFTGSLLGLGAALVGVSPVIGGLRPWHLLVCLAFMVVISGKGAGALLALKVTAIDLAFGFFILLSATVEYLNASQLNFQADLMAVFTDVFYILAYLTARLCVSSLDHCSKLLRGIIWPALPMAVLGIMQVLGVGIAVRLSTILAPTEAVTNRLERGDAVRAWGLTGHWTGFGGYLTCIIAALMCVILIDHATRRDTRKADVAALGILLGGVMSTLTISVIFSSLAIILVSWRRLKARVGGIISLAALGAMAVLVLAPFLAGRVDQQLADGGGSQDIPSWIPSTLAYRLVIWQRETVPAILDRPFLGWGSGAYDGDTIGRRYSIDLDWLSAESQWLSIAVGYGIWAALVFACLIVLIGMRYWRMQRTATGALFEPLLTMWIALFLTSFTVAIFTNRGTPSVFYILLGCAAAVYGMASNPENNLPPKDAVPVTDDRSPLSRRTSLR